MAMQIRQVTTFGFSLPVGETTYNFQIPADNQREACQKLITALETVIAEVRLIMKPGLN